MQPETLDDLIAIYVKNPAQWKPNFYVFFAKGEEGKTTNGTLGPCPIPPGPVDEFSLWQSICARMGAPGRVVVRLSGIDGVAQESIAVSISEPMYRVYAARPVAPQQQQAAPVQQQQQQYPPQQPYPYYPPPPPPTDMLALMFKSQTETQNMLIGLVTKPREDPAIGVLQKQIEVLSNELRTERERKVVEAKEDRNQWIEYGTKMAKEGGGLSDNAVNLVSGALTSIGEGIKATAAAKSEIELLRAKAELAREERLKAEATQKLLKTADEIDEPDETTTTETSTPPETVDVAAH